MLFDTVLGRANSRIKRDSVESNWACPNSLKNSKDRYTRTNGNWYGNPASRFPPQLSKTQTEIPQKEKNIAGYGMVYYLCSSKFLVYEGIS